jgi:hypothetical protein
MAEQSTPQSPAPEQPKEPTIIFLFDLKNWYETISPLSKLDLFDIVPLVSTQFYMDFGIKAYVLILTKTKWDNLNVDVKKKFMLVSRRVKEEMEGPMTSIQRETYEQADIFKLLMGESLKGKQESKELQPIAEEEEAE